MPREDIVKAYAMAERENRLRDRSRDMNNAADKPELKLLARLNMAYITPTLMLCILALGGLIWNDLREAVRTQGVAQDRQTQAFTAMLLEMNNLKNSLNAIVTFQIPSLSQFFNSRFDAQANRLDALSRSDEQQTKDIKELQFNAFRGGK